MAKKSAAEQSFQKLHSTIVSFVDASRRLKIAVERPSFSFTRTPVEGVDWAFLHGFLKDDIVESLVAVDSAVNALKNQMAVGQSSFPPAWAKLVDSAWRIGKWACDDARTAGWFEGKFVEINIRSRHQLEKLNFATTLVEVVLGQIEVSTLPDTHREVLQSLLERSPQKPPELAKSTANKRETTGAFRKQLTLMKNNGLLYAGRGKHSPGYSLTERGIGLALIVRQLQAF